MDNYDITQAGPEEDGQKPIVGNAPEIDPARRALVKEWNGKLNSARKWLKKKSFDRMDKCQQMAIWGADKEWVENENYVVPVVKRHIDQAVSALYARNPRAIATRKKRLNYTIWDGRPDTAKAAFEMARMGDPNAMALLQEIEQVRQQNGLLEKTGQTLEVLHQYYLNEQAYNYKQQIKALVRRTKINGVGYIKLNFQRILELRADITAQINDVTSQISSMEGLLAQAASEQGIERDSAKMEEMRLLLRDLQSQQEIIVREGPVFDFPRSTEIIFDPSCRHLKTWAGARWIAHEFDMTPEEILEVYKVDVGKEFTKYKSDAPTRHAENDKETKKREVAKVWEVQDKKNGQFFTICDGYCDFIKEPSLPDVQIERFFTVFPLVFNEVESDEDVIPPSDVWLSRHMQNEYNRSRQGLREHRIANRPYYVTERGKLEENDKDKLANHPANAIIELNGLLPGQKIQDVLQRGEIVPIDPNVYEVNMIYQDMLRVVGSQEANLGSTAGSTATESSIAESSRMSSMADNVDDLDDLLTELARSVCQLMLLELSKETVVEIAGPGAVWPEMRPTREEIAKELTLEVKAGSSGRPNKAAELANLERAMPFLLQMPNLNPEPLLKRYLDLLEIDLEDAIAQGLPSVTAINAMLTKQLQQSMGVGGGPMADPTMQGGEGMDNAPQPTVQSDAPQAGYPAPGGGGGLP